VFVGRDKIVTGSFDRKAKIWDANTGQRYHTLKGHKMEIVCLSFDPHGTVRHALVWGRGRG